MATIGRWIGMAGVLAATGCVQSRTTVLPAGPGPVDVRARDGVHVRAPFVDVHVQAPRKDRLADADD